MFQHRHYVKIAATIAALKDNFTREERETIAHAFVAALRPDNPRFDPARFMDAAMGEPQTGRDRPR